MLFIFLSFDIDRLLFLILNYHSLLCSRFVFIFHTVSITQTNVLVV